MVWPKSLTEFSTQALLLFILSVWSVIWKGFALWHAAQGKEKNWFIAILILNTVGILEIAYLFFFAKEKLDAKKVISEIKKILTKKFPHSKS